jgi:hypothetical protein
VGTTAREIEQHIATERVELDRNIRELQTRVKNVTDWKWQVRKRPLGALAVAAGGGFAAAMLARSMNRSSREPRSYEARSYYEQPRGYEQPRRRVSSRDTLVGFAMGMGMRGLAKYLQS